MLSSACSDLGDLIMSNIENVGPIDPAEKTSPILNEKGTVIYLGTQAGTPEVDVCLYASKTYILGMEVCAAGRVMQCGNNGTWVWTSRSCCGG